MSKPDNPYIQLQHPLNDGLVAAWLFTEGCGGLIEDNANATNGHAHGVLASNPPTWTQALNGPGVSFDGSAQYANCTNALSRYVDRWTIAARVFPTSYAGFSTILARGQGSDRNFELRLDQTTGKITAVFTSAFNTFKFATGATGVTLSTWNTVAGTFDGSTITVYLNGVSDGSAAAAFTPENDGTMLSIGSLNGTNKFAGVIEEVRLWDRALSLDELRAWEDSDYSEFRPRQQYFKPAAAAASGGILQTAVSMM